MGQGILEFPKIRHCGIPSLREFRHCEALKKEGAISLGHRHCEGAKRPKQSHWGTVIASEAKQSRLEFQQIRHCEGAKRPKQSLLLNLGILNEIASSFVLLTPRNDGILEFLKHRHCEALKKEGAISLGHRHCEGAKRPKQSHQIAVIAREQSDRSNLIKSPSLRAKRSNLI